MFKCAVTDYVEPDLAWEATQYQQAKIAFEPLQLRNAKASDIATQVSDADVLVVDQARITAEVIASLERCALVIRHGDGYDNIDLAAATEYGIVCVNKPGFWSREVAELAFCLAISLCLRLPAQQRVAAAPQSGPRGGWKLSEAMPQRSISAMTVGVIGFGRIGRHSVKMFGDVCQKVLVHDPFIISSEIEKTGATAVSLRDLVSRSDIITIHTPANADTIDMFDTEQLARMKRGAILVNTARGPIVQTDALLSALETGHLGGAGLDVTVPEPLPADHPLFLHPNVIITPHLGWYSEDALWNMRRSIVSDVIAASKGTLPDTVLNPDVLTASNLRWVHNI